MEANQNLVLFLFPTVQKLYLWGKKTTFHQKWWIPDPKYPEPRNSCSAKNTKYVRHLNQNLGPFNLIKKILCRKVAVILEQSWTPITANSTCKVVIEFERSSNMNFFTAKASYQRRPSSPRNREGNVRFPTNLHGVGRSARPTSRWAPKAHRTMGKTQ